MTPLQKWLVVVALSLGSLACLGWCARRASSLGDRVRTDATIVRIDVHTGIGPNSGTNRTPVAAFEVNGELREYPLRGSANSPNCCNEGEVVPVLYLPDAPDDVIVARFSELYGPALLFAAVMGGFALVIGFLA
jgi:hypothetical protein